MWLFDLLIIIFVAPLFMIGGLIGSILSSFDLRFLIPGVASGFLGINLLPFSEPRENAEIVSMIEVIAQSKVFSVGLSMLLIGAAIVLIALSVVFKILGERKTA